MVVNLENEIFISRLVLPLSGGILIQETLHLKMDRESRGQLLHCTATKFIKICQNNILEGSVTLETSMKKRLVVSSSDI